MFIESFSMTQFDLMTRQELIKVYQEVICKPPPVKARKEFLLGNISWHIQAQSISKNANHLRQKIVMNTSRQKILSNVNYKAGTRLIREWRGISHEVLIEANYFVWQQRKYKSLSEIAREITGTRWSGPRFFGLKN